MPIVTIEKLLHWAFVMEMPLPDEGVVIASAGFGPWGAIERIGALGTMVDASRSPCDSPSSWVIGQADPDAVKVVNAVAELDDMTLREEDGFDILAGWPYFGSLGEEAVSKAWAILARRDQQGRMVIRSAISTLIRRVAVLGTWPDWVCDAPRVDMATVEGKPAWFRKVMQPVEWDATGVAIRSVEVEVDGRNKVSRRPYPGAYRKYVLTPDVSGKLARRIEYTLTHAALTTLAADLDGLGGRKVLPPMCSPMPWAVEEKNLRVGA